MLMHFTVHLSIFYRNPSKFWETTKGLPVERHVLQLAILSHLATQGWHPLPRHFASCCHPPFLKRGSLLTHFINKESLNPRPPRKETAPRGWTSTSPRPHVLDLGLVVLGLCGPLCCFAAFICGRYGRSASLCEVARKLPGPRTANRSELFDVFTTHPCRGFTGPWKMPRSIPPQGKLIKQHSNAKRS